MTTPTLHEAARLALAYARGEATRHLSADPMREQRQQVIDTLEAVLAAQAAEPVAWYDSKYGWVDFTPFKPTRKPSGPDALWLPLYAAPQPARVPQPVALPPLPNPTSPASAAAWVAQREYARACAAAWGVTLADEGGDRG